VTLRRLALIILSAWVLLALGTYLAGERTEVAVLHTYDSGGGDPKETKMWVVDYEGAPYVRIGRPGRGWGERAKAHPDVELTRSGQTTPRHAAVITDPTVLSAVDAAFADKYGWVDWWFGVVIRKNPETLRLDPRT
jgi:hypothetical protein